MLFSDSIKTISSLKFFAWNAHSLMTLNSVLLLPFACCSPVFQKCFYCSEIRDGNLKSFHLVSLPSSSPPFATLSSSLAAERGMASTLNSLASWTAAQLQVLPLVTYTEGKSGQNISTQDTFSIRPRSNDNFTDGLWSPPVSAFPLETSTMTTCADIDAMWGKSCRMKWKTVVQLVTLCVGDKKQNESISWSSSAKSSVQTHDNMTTHDDSIFIAVFKQNVLVNGRHEDDMKRDVRTTSTLRAICNWDWKALVSKELF